jgi:hypothetical protein
MTAILSRVHWFKRHRLPKDLTRPVRGLLATCLFNHSMFRGGIVTVHETAMAWFVHDK